MDLDLEVKLAILWSASTTLVQRRQLELCNPPLSLPRRRGGRWAVENAQRFPRGVGGCRVGGWGRQPSIPRQTAGRGDEGAGEGGTLSTEACGKTITTAAQDASVLPERLLAASAR